MSEPIEVAALVERKCNECSTVYPVMVTGTEASINALMFQCRRCRLVTFAEAVEELRNSGPEKFGLSDADVGPYMLQFYSAVDELYEMTMESQARRR